MHLHVNCSLNLAVWEAVISQTEHPVEKHWRHWHWRSTFAIKSNSWSTLVFGWVVDVMDVTWICMQLQWFGWLVKCCCRPSAALFYGLHLFKEVVRLESGIYGGQVDTPTSLSHSSGYSRAVLWCCRVQHPKNVFMSIICVTISSL